MYAQSPHSMRGMMIGLFFWVDGIFSTLSAIVLFGFSINDQNYSASGTHLSCGFWYYLVFVVVGIATFIPYVVFSRKYQNRTRGDVDSERYYRLHY
jgi:ABC-type amino acid transport system permease subunit